MFRALLAHLLEALHQQQLVFCLRVTSVGLEWNTSSTPILVAANSQHGRKIPIVFCAVPPEDEQAVLETCNAVNL
jgi:hypothetical protein